jgi:hypothetical protein
MQRGNRDAGRNTRQGKGRDEGNPARLGWSAPKTWFGHQPQYRRMAV